MKTQYKLVGQPTLYQLQMINARTIDEFIGIVDKDWNNFKVTKDSKYLYSTLKFIEMLQETV